MDSVVSWLQRTLILWLVLTSYIALKWTEWFPAAIDPFSPEVFTNNHLYASIAVTMLAVGLLLPRDEVQNVIRRWPMVLAGTAVQYISMPLLAMLVAKIWGFQDSQLIGVIIVGCVPGAMASNVLTMNAGGNVSYSVSLTSSATLLSPIAVPIALWATLSGDGKVTPGMLLQSSMFLLMTVVVPVVVGHLIARRCPSCERQFKVWGTLTANLVILLIIAAVVGRTRQHLAVYDLRVLWALLVINIVGYAVGYFAGRVIGMPEAMRRAITLEVGMQNAGVGTALAMKLFDAQTALAPALYTFGCMLTGTILAGVWSLQPIESMTNDEIPVGEMTNDEIPVGEMTNDEIPNDEGNPKSE